MQNLIGHKFSRLLVKSLSHKNKWGQYYWRCFCECGKIRIVYGGNLRSGRSRSCGCLHREIVTKHSSSNSPEYNSWVQMLHRCQNPKASCYERYGGRGIKVCKRWKKSFKVFLSDMGSRPENTTLDRINNDGDYTPKNCRWATRNEQANNTQANIHITINSETHTMVQWARIVGLNYTTLRMRVQAGWPPKEAVFKPVKR